MICDDGEVETQTYRKNKFAGIRIQTYNEDVTDCIELVDVQFCYEWWISGGTLSDCYIAVDAEGGISYSNVTTTCPGTTTNPGVTCVNVTAIESWTCGNFFGTNTTRAFVQHELSNSEAGQPDILTTDVLFFNVTYEAAPHFSDITEDPASSAYSLTQFYAFNITWTDDAQIDNVFITFNGTNFSLADGEVYSLSDVYTFNRTGLAAGDYTYQWFANDTDGHENQTSVQIYTLQKATSAVALTLNNLSSDITLLKNNNVTTNASLAIGTGTISLSMNGTLLLTGNSPLVREDSFANVGQYVMKVEYSGNENYSSSSQQYTITVPAENRRSGGPVLPGFVLSLPEIW